MPHRLMLTLVLLVSSLPSIGQSNEQQEWWFNVELFAFKRTLQPSNNEDFTQGNFDINYEHSNQLLYLAALNKSTNYENLGTYLKTCGAKTTHPLAVNFDVNFEPKTQFASNSENTTNEQTLNDFSDFSSNQALLNYLLTPLPTFYIESSTSDLQLARLNNTAESIALNIEKNEDSRQQQVNTLNKLIDYLMSVNTQYKDLNVSQASVMCKSKANTPLTAYLLPFIDQELFSDNQYFDGYKQLLSKEDLSLQDYVSKVIKQRDIQALLYTAWRQEVKFGSENAEFYRLTAGKLLESLEKPNYEAWLEKYEKARLISESESDDKFFAELINNIEKNEKTNWLNDEAVAISSTEETIKKKKAYELDGLFKVYLDYVNQVPYLHIDSEFKHYRLALDESGNSEIKEYPFKQRRRIISKQIHYFDHPAFGLIVRLERFTPESETTDN